MKKIILFFLVAFLCNFSYAQFPITQNLGAPKTLVVNKGGFQSDTTLILPTFNDTTAANQSTLVKIYPGNLIRVKDTLYFRNKTATAWVKLATGDIVSTNIYNSDGTLTANRTVSLGNRTLSFLSDSANLIINPSTKVSSFGGGVTQVKVSYGDKVISLNADTTVVEGKLRILDGSEDNGYVLTSDARGVATWQKLEVIPDSSVFATHYYVDSSIDAIATPTLQQAFDANPTAGTQINAHGNNYNIDSVGLDANVNYKNVNGVTQSSYGLFGGNFWTYSYDSIPKGSSILVTPDSLQLNYIDYLNAPATGFSNFIMKGENIYASGMGYPIKFGINTATPDSSLHLIGGLKLDMPSKGAGKVLTSDANGAATWQYSSIAAPTLQSVTDSGNITTNSIEVDYLQTNGDVFVGKTGAGGALEINDGSGNTGRLQGNYLTGNRTFYLPDSSGTLTVSVNGVKADSTGNITIPSGSGTVTSISQGYGITNTPNPITTTGTISVDTTTSGLSGKYVRISDTANVWLSAVSKPNDSSLSFTKGTTVTTYSISSVTNAKRLITSVYNNSGATILKGAVIYINGAHSSNLPTIALAQSNQESTSAYTYGLVENDISNNSQGTVIQSGTITNLNLPTSTYTDGQTLYLSPTVPGGYTLTKPTAPNHYVAIGTITRAHPVFGTIQVAIRNGFQLDEMSDVQIPAVPNDSALLQFSRTDSLWHSVSTNTVLNGRMEAKQDTSTSWKTTGNFNVNAGQFIGSRNNASLRFRTNNTERVVIDSIGSVGIGTSLAAASSLVDITSTTKGLLIPRVTTTQRDAISSPASQLLVSNTTKKTLDQYNGTTWNSIAGDYNRDLLAAQAMGSPIKAGPLVYFYPQSGAALVSTRSAFNAIWVDKEITITGAAFMQTAQGVYTGINYNGIALYSFSGGTVTLIDSTTRDTEFWKTASTSAGTWVQKTFAGGSRTLQPGLYYLLALYNSSAQTTAPSIGASAWTPTNVAAPLTTNSAKLWAGVINGVTTPPSSQLCSAWNIQNFYFALYLY